MELPTRVCVTLTVNWTVSLHVPSSSSLLLLLLLPPPPPPNTRRLLRGRRYSDYSNVLSACDEMLTGHVRSPFLLAFLVDAYEEDGGEEKRQEAVKVRVHCFSIIDTERG